ncbi:MAG TPA: hypothetical protein VFY69_05025 [Solirubrobacterales bacterium]|nr:hypothetical protein [Solirubrobacterales bacterium]
MRLIPRNRHQQRHRKPRIAITEEEISADLHYPAQPREPRRTADARRLEIR